MRFIPLLLTALLAAGAAGAAEPGDSLAALLPDSVLAALPDSVVLFMAEPIRAEASVPTRMQNRRWEVELPLGARTRRDATRLEDLAPLLPSTRLTVNSRGEALFMMRGAPERHLPVFLDGIPLAQPWDERTDLSLIPLIAVQGVRVDRGALAFARGTGALAGAVELTTDRPMQPRRSSRLETEVGEAGLWKASLLHRRQVGRTRILAALSADGRDGFLLPEDHGAGLHQGEHRLRLNSHRRQNTMILGAAREWADGARLSAAYLASLSRRGVPPEEHRKNARFWRYPSAGRGLASLALHLPRRPYTFLDFALSVDRQFRGIRAYDDAGYATPALEPGVDFEHGEDLTAFARGSLQRERPGQERLALIAELRDSRHRESLTLGGPVEEYRQQLASLAGELSLYRGYWTLDLGIAAERAETPATGPHPDRGGISAGRYAATLSRRLAWRSTAFLSLSRRSRFPSMRELYSGALGSFEPNPGLDSERQDLVELGLRRDAPRGAFLTVDLFASRLKGGIEKEALPSGLYRRVNRSRLDGRGLELGISHMLLMGWLIEAQWSLLHSRARDEDGREIRAEDRPSMTGFASLQHHFRGVWILRAEAEWIGERHSADTSSDSGLRRLPPQGRMHLRLSRALRGGSLDGQVYLRLENVLDSPWDSQTGLAEAGRSLRGGVRISLAGH